MFIMQMWTSHLNDTYIISCKKRSKADKRFKMIIPFVFQSPAPKNSCPLVSNYELRAENAKEHEPPQYYFVRRHHVYKSEDQSVITPLFSSVEGRYPSCALQVGTTDGQCQERTPGLTRRVKSHLSFRPQTVWVKSSQPWPHRSNTNNRIVPGPKYESIPNDTSSH